MDLIANLLQVTGTSATCGDILTIRQRGCKNYLGHFHRLVPRVESVTSGNPRTLEHLPREQTHLHQSVRVFAKHFLKIQRERNGEWLMRFGRFLELLQPTEEQRITKRAVEALRQAAQNEYANWKQRYEQCKPKPILVGCITNPVWPQDGAKKLSLKTWPACAMDQLVVKLRGATFVIGGANNVTNLCVHCAPVDCFAALFTKEAHQCQNCVTRLFSSKSPTPWRNPCPHEENISVFAFLEYFRLI